VSFVAKNQFKTGIVKYLPKATEENDQMIATILNPKLLIKPESVKC